MNLLSKTTEQVCAFDEDASQSETESDNDSEYDNLDECIDKGLAASGSLHSIAKLIKGREALSKRTKTGDLQPIIYVRFNNRVKNAKAKPVTLRALIDTGVGLQHSKDYTVQILSNIVVIDKEWVYRSI